MNFNIQGALDEAGKVVKRQRVCEQKVDARLDQLIELFQRSKERLLEPDSTPDVVLQELQRRVQEEGLLKEMSNQVKECHSAINKLSKTLEKTIDSQPDVCKALRDVQFDKPTLNKVIAQHFYREGRFELGDLFAREAGVPRAEDLKQPYIAMHNILEQINNRNLQPALEWAQQHRQLLSHDSTPSSFEFKLHSLNFLHILSSDGLTAALQYARTNFPAFASKHMVEVQRLMGCLVFAHKAQPADRYAELLSPTRWDQIAQDFVKQACSLMGQAFESPLAVTVAAGTIALPALLKLATVMEKNLQDFKTCDQLPIEIELGPEFVFHSIFACPVSKDQSGVDNPPMLLPCNHVLCEQSILKIAKTRTRNFKCPYCPMEARADNLRQLFFPDAE